MYISGMQGKKYAIMYVMISDNQKNLIGANNAK